MLQRTYSLPDKTSEQLLKLPEGAKNLKVNNTPFMKLARSITTSEARYLLQRAILTIDRLPPAVFTACHYTFATQFAVEKSGKQYLVDLTVSKYMKASQDNPVFEIRNTVNEFISEENGSPQQIPRDYLSAERLLGFIDTKETDLQKEYFIVSAFSKNDKLRSEKMSLTNKEISKTIRVHNDYRKNKFKWWHCIRLKIFLNNHIDETVLQ